MVTVSEAITHDHRELEEYSNNILNAADADSKIRWQNQFIWELARHSIAEELVVYPAMERSVPNGKEAADKDRKEHLVVSSWLFYTKGRPCSWWLERKNLLWFCGYQVKEALYKFQGMKPEDANFESTLKDLMSNLREHIKEEEKDDLPALEKALESSESEKLARSFSRTKKFVPTR